MLLHKFFLHSDKLPIVIRNYCTLNRSVHSHSTRNCNSLHVSSVQSTFGKRSIKLKGRCGIIYLHHCWNPCLLIEYFPVYKPCCVIVLMFPWVHAKCSLLYSCVWMRGWWDGWYFTIFMFRFCWFFYINVTVLTMLAAFCFSDSPLRANFGIVSFFSCLMALLFVANKFLSFFAFFDGSRPFTGLSCSSVLCFSSILLF